MLVAIVVWRNSMVFHSVDKMTSLFIHVFPPMYTYIETLESNTENDRLSFMDWIVYPTLLYLIWQIGYLFKTEIIDGDFLASNPNIATSLRWLSNDEKNFMNKLTINYCRKLGIMKKDEKFDPSQWKTKLIFVFINFMYFLLTVIPVKLMYDYSYFHIACLFVTFMSSVFNGANYYIEVFSERYNDSLKSKQARLQEKYSLIEERLDEILKKKFKEIEDEFSGGSGGSSNSSINVSKNVSEKGSPAEKERRMSDNVHTNKYSVDNNTGNSDNNDNNDGKNNCGKLNNDNKDSAII